MKAKENRPEEMPGMPGKNPFSVPENYFDEFPSRLQERMSKMPKPAERRIYTARRVLALAAMFIGLMTIGYFSLRVIWNDSGKQVLSAEEASAAIEYFSPEIDDEMLMAAIIETDIQLDSWNTDQETDAIIEYLSTEDIDLREVLIY